MVHEGRDNFPDPRDRDTSLLLDCEGVISGLDANQRAEPTTAEVYRSLEFEGTGIPADVRAEPAESRRLVLDNLGIPKFSGPLHARF